MLTLQLKAEVQHDCPAELGPPNMKLGYALPMIDSTPCLIAQNLERWLLLKHNVWFDKIINTS